MQCLEDRRGSLPGVRTNSRLPCRPSLRGHGVDQQEDRNRPSTRASGHLSSGVGGDAVQAFWAQFSRAWHEGHGMVRCRG